MAVRDFKKFFKRRGRFVRQPRNDKKKFQRSRDDKNHKSDRKCFPEVLGVIAVNKVMKRLKTKHVLWRKHLVSPSAVQSYGGNLYSLVIVDNYSGYSQNRKAYNILNKHTIKIKESLNVTFDETLSPSKTLLVVDDDFDEEEAIKVTEKKNLKNDIGDETLEVDDVVNIKKSKNHPLENVIGNLNQRTLREQAHASHKVKNIVSTNRYLELLHMDFFGPSAVQSYGGNLYTLVIVDDYSRYTWTRFLKNKTEAFEQFENISKGGIETCRLPGFFRTMNTTAQQITLDNALVAPRDRIKIGKCNMRINPTMTKKEHQVVLDALALTPLYPAFLITAKKKTPLIVEKPVKKTAKKPTARRQTTGVQIKDTPGVFASKKKAPAKDDRKKGVPDVSKADSSKSEYESWGDSGDDDNDDDQQGDDERTASHDEKSIDLNKTDDEEETHEDKFVHTPENYVPTNEETNDVDDEEYRKINEKMYDDVNVKLKDIELAD
nr:retrovirus-related Pol polyprotein from transposon TNT 1-94 [Tanacetum cinerariifolium]